MDLAPDVTALLAVIATATAGVLLVAVTLLGLRLGRLGRTYRAAIGPDAPDDLVEAVAAQRTELGRLRDDLGTVHGNTETLRELHRVAISRVGLVRYDAFPDMGGMLSFSAALMDERGDGIVLSAINGRQETRAYGKPLVSGDSEQNLSDEEQAAVRAAMDATRNDALATPRGQEAAAGLTVSRIAYLGPRATFTEAAARELGHDPGLLQPCRDIGEVLRTVADGRAGHGVVPIENRLEGGVSATLDALADDVDLLIEAEVDITVELVLAGGPGTRVDAVTEVWSHPVALASCRRWLAATLPDAELRPVSSTARAAADVAAAGRPEVAAIANPLAVQHYGLDELAASIADTDGNHTRFVQVGHDIPSRSGWDKTSLVVYIPDNHPGALFAMLEIFAERELDLTKIESRPTKHELGDYRFFVDVAGHLADERIADALAAVKRTQRDVKLLGSYPRRGVPPAGSSRQTHADDEDFRASRAWVDHWRDRIE